MVHKEFAKKKKNNFVCRFTGYTWATSCAPRTSEKDASLAEVLMEHDPGLSPAKSAKSTLCRTHIIHPIILDRQRNVHGEGHDKKRVPAWSPPCCAAGRWSGCARRRELRGWPWRCCWMPGNRSRAQPSVVLCTYVRRLVLWSRTRRSDAP
jgi:hypothetical protein